MKPIFAVVVLAALTLQFGPTDAAPAAKAEPQTYYLFAFSGPAAGKDAEYNSWVDKEYIPGMLAIPGVVSAQRLAHNDMELTPAAMKTGPRNQEFLSRVKKPTQYAVMYKIVTGNISGVYDNVRARIKNSSAFDNATSFSYTFRTIAPMITNDKPLVPGDNPETGLVFVFNTPLPGKEDYYNKWYNAEHAPGVMRGTGFATGQRMVLDDVQLNGKPVIDQYLVLYSLVVPSIDAVFTDYQKRRAQRPQNANPKAAPPANDFPYDVSTDFNLTYKVIGPVIEAVGTKIGKTP